MRKGRRVFLQEEDSIRLEDYGVIFVNGSIDNGTAKSVCEEIISINMEGKVDHIQMIINSPGGSLYDGFAIVDMMDWSKLPIHTTGMGIIASMGLMIFMAGEKGSRLLSQNTSLLSHRYSIFQFFSKQTHSDLLARRKEEDILFRRLISHYKKHTKLESEEDIKNTVLKDVDFWFTPQEAIELGFADKIIEG